jgi:hypothetical protein
VAKATGDSFKGNSVAAESVPKPYEEGGEHQDNADVCQQPCPKVVPEKQNVNPHHGGYERQNVNHWGRSPAHAARLRAARLPKIDAEYQPRTRGG